MLWLARLVPALAGHPGWVVLAGGFAVLLLLPRQRFGLAFLCVPLAVLFTFFGFAGLRPSPRFFIWALPVVVAVGVCATTRLLRAGSKTGISWLSKASLT